MSGTGAMTVNMRDVMYRLVGEKDIKHLFSYYSEYQHRYI